MTPQLKRSRPLVAYSEIPPPRYYEHTATYMMKVLEERALAVIVQRNSDVKFIRTIRYKSGIRRPIVVTKPSQIVKLARRGAVDIMFTVSKVKEELPDVFVVDIKADKNVWIHQYNWHIFDLVVSIVKYFLEFSDVKSYLICFDGMNGYKVITLFNVDELKAELNDDRSRLLKYYSACIDLLRDLAIRIVKRYKHVLQGLDLFSHMLISGNTTVKIGLCRAPLSLHWSTKLVSVPLAKSIRDYAVTESLPSRVIECVHVYGDIIERGWRENPARKFIEYIDRYLRGDFEIIYRAKAWILSHLKDEFPLR